MSAVYTSTSNSILVADLFCVFETFENEKEGIAGIQSNPIQSDPLGKQSRKKNTVVKQGWEHKGCVKFCDKYMWVGSEREHSNCCRTGVDRTRDVRREGRQPLSASFS